MTNPNPSLLTVTQFYEQIGGAVSRMTIYKAIRSGQIKHRRFGKKILIFADQLTSFTAQPEEEEPPLSTAALLEKAAWSLDEASAWSTLSRKLLRRAAHDHRFPAHRSGQGWVIPREPFMAWFNGGDIYTSIDDTERMAERESRGWSLPATAKTQRKAS